jgi:hypothetical protein
MEKGAMPLKGRERYCSFCYELFDRRALFRSAEAAICARCVCQAVSALQPAALVAAHRAGA